MSRYVMNAGLRNSRLGHSGAGRLALRALSLALVFMLALGVALGPFAGRAAAETVRIASVVSVTGTVEVKKAGGKKYFKAYKNMPLNAGDHLKTGNKSTVSIKVQDRGDEAMLGSGSSLYISELKDSKGKKKSNFTLWTGSVWVKATSLVSTEDEFEVETPTAVMGVRGTTFMVKVDPRNGDSTFLMTSGVGEVQSKNPATGTDKVVEIYPNQSLWTYFDESSLVWNNGRVPLEVEEFVQSIDTEILQAIIGSKAKIDQENSDYLKRMEEMLKSGTPEARFPIQQQEDLLRTAQNMEHLISNLIKLSIGAGKVDEKTILDSVDQANKTLEKKIDLDGAKPLGYSDKDALKLKELERKKAEREKQAKEKERALQDEKQKQKQLLDKLAEMKRLQDEANKKALEDAKKKIEEEYLKKLEEAKAKQYEEDKKKLEGEVPSPTQAPSDSGSPAPSPGGSLLNGSGVIAGPITQSLSGSGNVSYGPAGAGALTVNGNVNLVGGAAATGEYTLRGLTINGNLSINVPNGSVNLLENVTVTGTTTIVDVAPNTFRSAARQASGILIHDENGVRVVLQGPASETDVTVSGAGTAVLEGQYNGDIVIDGAAETVVFDGQFSGFVRVVAPGVRIIVNNGTVFTGTLDVRADGVKLEGSYDAIRNITYGRNIVLDESVQNALTAIAAKQLQQLNQDQSPQAMIGTLAWLGYANVGEWHAAKLIEHRELEFGGAFDNLDIAKEAIQTILERPLPQSGPELFVSEGLLLGDDVVLTFNGYGEWQDNIEEIRLYIGNATDDYIPVWEGDYIKADGSITILGYIFQDFPPGAFRISITAVDDEYLPSNIDFILSSPDYLSGSYQGEMPYHIIQNAEGSESRFFGPSDEWANQNGRPLEISNLTLSGNGSGTYTLRNLEIRGEVTIRIPNGNVTLDGSVEFASEGATIWIEEIGPGAGGTGGFTSYATYMPFFINVTDSGRTRIELSPAGQSFRLPDLTFASPGTAELIGTFEFVYIDMEGEHSEGNAERRSVIWSGGTFVETLVLYSERVEIDPRNGKLLSIVNESGVSDNELHPTVRQHLSDIQEMVDQASDALSASDYSGEAVEKLYNVLVFVGIPMADINRLGLQLWSALRIYGTEGWEFDLTDIRRTANSLIREMG